jgi:hypothetical protein
MEELGEYIVQIKEMYLSVMNAILLAEHFPQLFMTNSNSTNFATSACYRMSSCRQTLT